MAKSSTISFVLLALLCGACWQVHAQCGASVTSSVFTQPVMDPASIPKWVAKVPNPLAPGNIFTPDRTTFGAGTDYYRIGMRQINQQILPPGCPTTAVWAYGNANDPLNNPSSYSSPSKSIVAFVNRPVKVQWVHTQLPTAHLFPIDRTFHCGTAKNCTPDVRTVVHLHGAHVEPESDGFTDSWQSADGLSQGSLFDGSLYTYPNSQEACTMWFHDHAAGITRLNVYAGLAGFYVLRGTREISLQSLNLLPRYPFDVPIVIQDRTFWPNGSLAYPNAPFTSPRIFNNNFGNVFMVNGVTWPKMLVERRKYRLRLLNGCNSRFLSMQFVSLATTNPSTLKVWQVGSDGGFLNAPVDLTGKNIILSPSERVDIVVDFGGAAVSEQFYLTNNAAAPYPYGAVPTGSMTTVILFKIKRAYTGSVPNTLVPPPSLRNKKVSLPNLSTLPVRKLGLFDVLDTTHLRLRRHLGTDELGPLNFCDRHNTTENPALGATEVWEVYNPTGETHPIHLHLVQFQVISRNNFSTINNRRYLGTGNFTVLPEERGWKDTIRVDPSTVVRLVATFDKPGLYMWHCHILEHEDYDMMRPICVGGSCTSVWMDMEHMPWTGPS